MTPREKIYNKLHQFQSEDKLHIETFTPTYENLIEEFITNAKLAGARVYVEEDEIKAFYETTIKDSFSYVSSLGVAENGALWCQGLKEDREKLFSCNDLIVSVNQSHIVPSMHEAYEKINFLDKSFGTFIAGPSKTADIEQSLVIGAHGAMNLHIILIK